MILSIFDWSLFCGFFVVVSFSLWKSLVGAFVGGDYFLFGCGLAWCLIVIWIVAANISTEPFVDMTGQGAGSVGLAKG